MLFIQTQVVDALVGELHVVIQSAVGRKSALAAGGQPRRFGSVQSQYRQAVAVDDGFQLILIQTR